MVLLKGFWKHSCFPFLFSAVFLFSSTACSKPVVSKRDNSPDFQMKNISLGDKKLSVAIADNGLKRQYGLMHRASWGDIQGMLFIFENEAPRSFWMKNTLLALSIGFFGEDLELQEIQDLNPPKSLLQKHVDRAFSKKPARYVLEVPQGWFNKNGIKPGAKLKISN